MTMQTTTTKCGSCNAEIVWRKTGSGKPVPLNPEILYVSPNGHGKRVLLMNDFGQYINGFACKKSDHGAKAGRQTHFATCPNAGQHRKNKKTEPTPDEQVDFVPSGPG